MPLNSEPLPTRRERCAPTSPSGWGASARESKAAGCGSTARSTSGSTTGPQRKPAHAPVSATCSPPSGRRPQRVAPTPDLGHPLADQPADGAPQRREDDVRRALQHPGHVLDPVERLDGQGAHRPLALVQPQHPQVGGQPRRGAGVVQQPQQRGHQERRGQHHQHGRAEGDRADQAGRRDRAGAGQRRGGPPAGHRRSSARSGPAPGSGASAPSTSTESTTLGPDAAVIHSSGRTVTRCPSTARATDFTSSGTT